MRKRTVYILIAISFIIGIAAMSLINSFHRKPSVAAVHISVDKQEKAVAEKESSFKKKEDHLLDNDKKLSARLYGINEELKKATWKNKVVANKLEVLVSKVPPFTLTNSDNITVTEIRTETSEMLEIQSEKDSLQNVMIETMEKQLRSKDSLVILFQQQYLSLKVDFASSLQQQQLLESENKQYKKKFTKQKNKRRLFALATIIVSAIILRSILK